MCVYVCVCIGKSRDALHKRMSKICVTAKSRREVNPLQRDPKTGLSDRGESRDLAATITQEIARKTVAGVVPASVLIRF